ncbi:MAG: hypothetical protein P8L49_00280 [Opitutaceae bacterium]|nr:hypothetical protein [Opitutaceae bacterium]
MKSFGGAGSDDGFVEIEGESYFRIERSSEMAPFLINLVSANNHWMFISSNGALTAGRRNADNALFPYCTQDKLFEQSSTVGSASMLWVDRSEYDAPRFWEPFKEANHGKTIQRNLYKNQTGNKLIFEELNFAVGVSFRYLWTFSDLFGFARKAWVENLLQEPVRIRILDGIQNLVPYGLDQAFVSQYSNLSDAYKKCELLDEGKLAIFYLSSVPTDRAEPSEGLRATVAWSLGLACETVLLSSRQREVFRNGKTLSGERDIRGMRGAYLVESLIDLDAGGQKDWWIVAEINQDAAQVESLQSDLRTDWMRERLEVDIEKNVADLRLKVASADGLSLTSDRLRDSRHYSNTLFNIMRGGVFYDAYRLDVSDFVDYVESRNRSAFSGLKVRLDKEFGNRENVDYDELVQWASQSGDARLIRLSREYLPLTFSRRHGDPSRPWNRFSIETQDKLGNPVLGYEGNWRDIFQNWEALACSYPGYVEGMVFRFLNSSTLDGYNPYRITRDGIDWETIEPDSPWSNIGYWGDHQIIYLLKLLETSVRYHPEVLRELLGECIFTYTQVPYRIRSFSEIWKNPRETIDFSDEDAAKIDKRCSAIGTDGKLLVDRSGEIEEATLAEKLLIPLLSKLSNFVPDGGIWMNTQRPEWNDANNALVGYGISMVTLGYVNRYIEFMLKLLEVESDEAAYLVHGEVMEMLTHQSAVFDEFESSLVGGFDSKSRMEMVRMLGIGGESFRNQLYENGFAGSWKSLSLKGIIDYLKLSQRFVEASIDANLRADLLYHSYNLIKATGGDCLELDRLPIMLEGQVAALSSGRLSVDQVVSLLAALRSSALYREDVASYLLYPDRELATFLEKNVVSRTAMESNRLLVEMIKRCDERVIKRDVVGQFRFNGDFRNSDELRSELENIAVDYPDFSSADILANVKSIFDECFDHLRFTGRSSTFFAYEGLGSVYWHMVSKLLLAIKENYDWAQVNGAQKKTLDVLGKYYFETFEGLGLNKESCDYGAFPIDAYSHTPKHCGAQQPGMTGQVKEDIITRFGEIGLKVKGGQIRFEPLLLRREAFLSEPAEFVYLDQSGSPKSKLIQSGELAVTFCQTLFVLRLGEAWSIRIKRATNEEKIENEASLSVENSQLVFERNSEILEVEVTIPQIIIGS